jgi:hypothetical protein
MPGLGEVGRHAAAHVAQPDECDACHDELLKPSPLMGEEYRSLAAQPLSGGWMRVDDKSTLT